MIIRAIQRLSLLAALMAPAAAAPGVSATPMLMAGAARVDISPTAAEMAPPFKTVHDPIYARALVLDNGQARAVLVVADVPTISADVAAELTRQIADQAHVPLPNVLLGASHTHSGMRVDTTTAGNLPMSPAFTRKVEAGVLEAVREAGARLQPARAGFAEGSADLNVNRNEWSAAEHRYIDGVDRTGREPIDHGLGVLKVESLSGAPLAFVLNYGLEPVVNMTADTEISGDAPGAASRYVEDRFGGKAVALFTIGAAGSPIYRPDRVARENGRSDPHVLVSAMGVILGEEALAASGGVQTASDLRIGAVQDSLICPGKTTTPLNLPNQCSDAPGSTLPACVYTTRDASPVRLNMAVLRIGELAMIETDANVTPALWLKLKAASPLRDTILVALTYGPMHYVMDDAAYPLNTYEATASRAKPGCAEQGLMKSSLQMIDRTR